MKTKQHYNSSLDDSFSELDIMSSTIVEKSPKKNGGDNRRRRQPRGETVSIVTDEDTTNNQDPEYEPPPPKKRKQTVQKPPRRRNLRPEDQRTLKILSEKFRFDQGNYECQVGNCHKKLECGKQSNLKRHLSNVHQQLYRTLFPHEISAKKHAELEAFNIVQDAVELVTVNGYPFSMLNASGMCGFVKSRLQKIQSEGYSVSINRLEVVKQVEAESNLIREYMKRELRGRIVSLMFDVCTVAALSMLGVNVTFMKDANVVCWSLGTIQINERHTAVNLGDQLYDILREYDLPLINVFTITTDTAKNAIATSNVLDLVANSADNSEDIAEDSIFDIDPDGFEFGADIENQIELQKIIENTAAHTKLVNEMAESVRSKITTIRLINQVNCGAHVFQLSVNDSLEESDSKYVIQRVHDMCKLMRSQFVMIYIRKLGCDVILPPLDNVTRWNSKFLMVGIPVFILNCEICELSLTVCYLIYFYIFYSAVIFSR